MRALSGIRIVEFATGIPGPAATDLLALMGAEVIKVESRRKLDLTRMMVNPSVDVVDPDASPRFNEANLNKIGITLNMSQPQGSELAKRLIMISDAVVENFATGVIERLGLNYEVVKELKPDIVMLSASGSGRTGPEAGILGHAPVFSALSGICELTGYPDGEPIVNAMSADLITSATIGFALLAALCHRQRTGQGQYIDYSAREGLSCAIGDSIMDYTMNSRVRSRNGNKDDIMAPHNCYPCQGEDQWVSIAISTEEEWEAFCGVIGNPEWTKDETFADPYSRWRNQEELDRLVGEWTMKHTHYEVMEILQKVGVAAVPSFSAKDLYSDSHLASRDFMEVVEHPKLGTSRIIRHPWRLSATQPQITHHAPLLGEHNEYVFNELLGMEKAEIAGLAEKEIIF